MRKPSLSSREARTARGKRAGFDAKRISDHDGRHLGNIHMRFHAGLLTASWAVFNKRLQLSSLKKSSFRSAKFDDDIDFTVVQPCFP